jgi:hypothetical protein
MGDEAAPRHVDEELMTTKEKQALDSGFDCSPLALAALNAPAGRWTRLGQRRRR